MRVLIVDPYYPSFLRAHYGRAPELAEASYEKQRRSLMDAFFSTADSYSHHLAAYGIEAHEVVPNCEPLQRAWLREAGLLGKRLPRRLSEQEVVLAQARAYEADVVYLHNVRWTLEATLRRLRRAGYLVVGQNATRAPGPRKLRLLDLLVTSFPHYVDRFRRRGLPTEYVQLAFDRRVLGRLEEEGAPRWDRGAVFVGALARFRQHRAAASVLARAAAATPLELWGYRLEGWPQDSPIRMEYRGEAWGLDMYRLLRSARISVNRHGEVGRQFANNLRLYEATGVGSLLLTDAKENLGAIFEVGEEVVAYRSADELIQLIEHYLDDGNEGERRRIAAAGQVRTLERHSYEVRMEQLAGILELARTRQRRART